MQSIQKPKDITDAEKTAKSTALPDKLIYSEKTLNLYWLILKIY